MKFKLDSQTQSDLGIIHTDSGKSLFDLFNICTSLGGKTLLSKIMLEPLSNKQLIQERIETISYLQSNPAIAYSLDIDKNSLDFIEHYLNYYDYPTTKPSKFRAVEKAILYRLSPNNHYYIIERGIDYTIELANTIYNFFNSLNDDLIPTFLKEARDKVLSIFEIEELDYILTIKELRRLKAIEIANFDYLFRYIHIEKIRYLIDLIYYLDVVINVGRVSEKKGFSYPNILDSKNRKIEAKSLFHPLVKNCVVNDICMDTNSNLLFVTGPNMSGKSTFLKSLGVSAYLAHIGFPVPAQSFSISLLTGIYSTINLRDNLNNNYSHFYSEVKRIKTIAQEMQNESNVLIVFDELFRGTNVKDAYEGSLAIISALAKTNQSFYVISTHIIEVADQLKDNNIKFVCLETSSEDGHPKYTYKLNNGISDERLGMHIIKRERIIEIINNIGL